jgi:peptidoglycan/LPS O-acetylase OafA/YrhL
VKRPTDAVTGRYLPALDGVRGVAIAGVFAYHLGYGWASGGYLGVDLFFVLSGFLITSLLVEEWSDTGLINLARFWGHRARRLLPALLAMLIVLSIWVAFANGGLPVDLGQLRGDALSTVFYVANWHFLFAHQSYFDRFAVPSPLRHTWSLAIEEQFYLIWPLVILALMAVTRRFGPGLGSQAAGRHPGADPGDGLVVPPRTWRAAGLALTVGGAIASAAWMAYLAQSGASLNRLYYGTDTRAFDLLVGASLAMLAAARPQPGPRARRLLNLASPVAVVVMTVCWARAGFGSRWMFEGGFLLCAISAGVLLADVRQVTRGAIAKALSFRPLRFVGKISYGLYLWHWPVIVELSPQRTGLSGLQLTAVRVGAAFSLSVASYYLIERPFRRGTLATWPAALRVAIAPFAMGVTSIAVVAATLPVAAGATPAPRTLVSTAPTKAAIRGIVGKPIALGFRPSAEHPLRVLLVGDSVMLSDSPAVGALLASTKAATVVNHSEWGWGLTHAPTWPTDVPAWIAESHPQLVVGMWSWDNGLVTTHPAQYRTMLEQFVRLVLRPGDGVKGVIFQQFPTAGPDNLVTTNQADFDAKTNAIIAKWNNIGASLTKVFPGKVMYFPIGYSVLLHGKFASWLPPEGQPKAPKSAWTRVRMTDNVHFCPAGAARYAAALLADLTSLYHLPSPASGWWKGSWTQNHVAYRYPTPAVCPNDHP